MTNSQSDVIPVWFILVDKDFSLQKTQPFKLKVAKTDEIDDIAVAAATRLRLDETFTEILKILDPIQYQHSHALRSTSQKKDSHVSASPRSLTQLLAQLKEGNMLSVQYLNHMDKVGHHFEDRPGMIQAIVKHSAPITKDKKRKREESSKTQDQVKAPLLEHLENIAIGSPPSDVLGEHGVKLRKDILFGRPAGQFALPVALYNQHLAKLQYKLSSLDVSPENSNELFKDTSTYLEVSRQFLEAAIDDHATEDSRWTASKSYFETLFGCDLIEQFRIPRSGQASNAKASTMTAKADACVVTTFNYKDSKGEGYEIQIPRYFFEFKKEKGLGNPIAQCARANAESVYRLRDQEFFFSTHFPAVFLGFDGHSFDISISVSLEYMVVDNILQLDLRDSIQRAKTIQQLARVASALVECSRALDDEYQQLTLHPESRHPLHPCFPRPTLLPLNDSNVQLPKLKFKGRLSRDNQLIEKLLRPTPYDMRSLLVASMGEGNDAASVVVKFVDNYGKEAHEILAKENVAPKLYSCQRVLGDVFMVVMEHLEGWQPMDKFKRGELSHSVFEDIEKALKKLGENSYVHGDLRAINIMVDAAKQRAQIVDFDWVAKEGKGHYPLTINKAELKSEWHPDVYGGGEMMKAHDEYALNCVLKPKYK